MSLPENNPQAKFDVFYETLEDVVNTCQPLRRNNIRNDQQWMTKEIKDLIEERQRVIKDETKWKVAANKVRNAIEKRKKSYYNRFTNKDSTVWWKVVNELKGQNKNDTSYSIDIESMNESFHSVWKNTTHADLSDFIKPPKETPTSQQPPTITPWAIAKELGNLQATKAAGPDNVSAAILKQANIELSEVITHLVNLSFQNSFVPEQNRS